jgi:hypothetical protein
MLTDLRRLLVYSISDNLSFPVKCVPLPKQLWVESERRIRNIQFLSFGTTSN